MKSEFKHENFEEFLKRNADNLRMKAPEKIWENITGELKKSRKRFGAGLSAFLMFTSLLAYLTISNTAKQVRVTDVPAPAEQARSQTTSSAKAVTIAAPTGINKNINRTTTPSQASTGDNDENIVTALTAEPEANPGSAELLADNDFEATIVDSYPEAKEEEAAGPELLKPAFLSQTNSAPWTIESTFNAYKSTNAKRKRFQTQFHFAPTISYRKLTENKSYLRNAQQPSSINYAALYSSVNNMVTHKPDLGFELGVTEKYSVSEKVRIRAGLQFNVNRYDIKAFQAPYAVATIALNNRRTAQVDSVRTTSSYSNVDVNRNNRGSWLQNFSFQASAPVGVEVSLKGNDKMQFGIAGSVQPTYVLGDRTYMITTDYKRYTQVPWMLRRWNVNTSFETFVLYNTGKTTWQVGPQVRYQLLSSFISNYPVKENLFDFGLKIGISVNK
ncbi:MAG TPA: hypothetical protein VGN63_02390 [Flavisolibacter sp.]|jgi:hypothetical protein|nr:hypothetical protein [Flavisolibacter sp.]